MSKMKCSFCGGDIDLQDIKDKKNISFAGINNEIICSKCVKRCNEEILKLSKQKISNDIEFKYPRDIKNQLDEWIIGQDKSKIILANALYNHFKRIYKDNSSDDKLEKSNVLLVGSTGSGKTASIKALAKSCNLPIAIEDVTNISSVGYVGRNVEDLLASLLDAADGNIELAQKGIIFLDEGDKLRRKAKDGTAQKDVNGEGVQQGLLKLVEGGVYDVKYSKGTFKFDTTNVLFILGGSFEGIDKIVKQRLKAKDTKSSTGFMGKLDNTKDINEFNKLISEVKHVDLMSFGMTPELLGRFPVVASLEELSIETLVKILTEPKNALVKQFKKSFELDGVELEFTNKALESIAKKAKERKIGARALRSLVEELLQEAQFETPNSDIVKVIVQDDLTIKYVHDMEI